MENLEEFIKTAKRCRKLLETAKNYLQTANEIIIEGPDGDEQDYLDTERLIKECTKALKQFDDFKLP